MEHNEELRLYHSRIVEALKTIYDPEIPVNIYDLGLIYEIKVHDDLNVDIKMTLTSPNCPVAESLPVDVEIIVKEIKELRRVNVEVVLDPPWSIELMTDEAKLDLGFL